MSGSIKLQFRVTIDRDADNKHKLSIECSGNTEPWLSVNRCIASRPQPDDFRSALVCLPMEMKGMESIEM